MCVKNFKGKTRSNSEVVWFSRSLGCFGSRFPLCSCSQAALFEKNAIWKAFCNFHFPFPMAEFDNMLVFTTRFIAYFSSYCPIRCRMLRVVVSRMVILLTGWGLETAQKLLYNFQNIFFPLRFPIWRCWISRTEGSGIFIFLLVRALK